MTVDLDFDVPRPPTEDEWGTPLVEPRSSPNLERQFRSERFTGIGRHVKNLVSQVERLTRQHGVGVLVTEAVKEDLDPIVSLVEQPHPAGERSSAAAGGDLRSARKNVGAAPRDCRRGISAENGRLFLLCIETSSLRPLRMPHGLSVLDAIALRYRIDKCCVRVSTDQP